VTTTPPATPTPRRHWLHFSPRTMMVLVIGYGFGVASLSRASRSRRGLSPQLRRSPTGAHDSQPAGDPALASLSSETLVERLVEESSEGIGSHSTAWFGGFIAINETPRFHGGVLGAAKPKVSPVMRELVRRGVAALLVLIRHLTDARPTKLTVGEGFMGRSFRDEYSPRYVDPNRQPHGVNHRKDLERFDRYTLKVGDLCYVVVGQIVNRGLRAVRYQPSLCLVVNSPIETPALADAVKADWDGLTAEEHQRSLYEDALDLANPWAAQIALPRLLYYYPGSGKSLALRMLDRPFYDAKLVDDFFIELVDIREESRWEGRLSSSGRRTAKLTTAAFSRSLSGLRLFPKSQSSEDRERSRQVADKLLGEFFPWFAPRQPPFLEAVDFDDQQRLIEALAAFPRQFLIGRFLGCSDVVSRSAPPRRRRRSTKGTWCSFARSD